MNTLELTNKVRMEGKGIKGIGLPSRCLSAKDTEYNL